MTRTRNTQRTTSLPAGIAAGVFTAMITTLCASALTAKMLQYQWLDEEKIGYGAMLILFITAWIGAVVSYSRIKQHKIIISLIFALSYFALLLGITVLFFEGRMSGVGETVLLIMGGSFLTVFLKTTAGKKKIRKKQKRYNR